MARKPTLRLHSGQGDSTAWSIEHDGETSSRWAGYRAPSDASGASRGAGSTASVDTGPLQAIVPTDPLYASQWHLTGVYGINATAAWNDYAGRGIKVGIVDDGFSYTHGDLDGNYRTDLDYDARSKDSNAFSSTSGDKHGTAVAGAVGAEWSNGYGGTGVAWDVDIVGFRMGFGASGSTSQILDNFKRQIGVDISSNSWGYGGYFSDNFNSATFAPIGQAMADAAKLGRGGLGTTFVFAAGNERTAGQNVNYHDFQNSPFAIAVAATDSNGNIASFSTPGAAVLIAAPGVGIVTTDRQGFSGYVSGDFVSVSGTSFSAPIVSGVVALMLEANRALGYRDIQEILAYSASKPPGFFANDQTNKATNWNGGGLTVSHDYGFGLVDAHAAVRLAETWTQQSTFANIAPHLVYLDDPAPNLAIPDGTGAALSRSITVTNASDAHIVVDRVEIALDITHTWIGDLIVTLSHNGATTSTLVNRPGVTASSAFGSSQDNIKFTMDSVQFMGEEARGTWTLSVKDAAGGDVGTLNFWSINFIGDLASVNDTYFYTDWFSSVAAEPGRALLNDADGGYDTFNAAAISAAVILNLAGGLSQADGVAFSITADTIERAFLGDGSDTAFGNALANALFGGRGNDILSGAGGNDTLVGGIGADTLTGGPGGDTFDFNALAEAGDTVSDFSIGDRVDIHDLMLAAGASSQWSQQTLNANNNGIADVAVFVDPDGGGALAAIRIVTVLDHAPLALGTEFII